MNIMNTFDYKYYKHIQSVRFDKKSWTVEEAQNWLRENNFTGLTVSITPNQLRFRQFTPRGKYDYVVKKKTPTIQYVIRL